MASATACPRPALDPTPTPITFPPTPTAIAFPPTPTAIILPPTPTAIRLTPAGPATPAAAPELTTPQIVELLRPSVVQIAVLKSGVRGVGTGVVFDTHGHVLTNWHVVSGATSIQVSFQSGEVLPASVFREDPAIDIAVVKVQQSNLRPALFGDSSKLSVGETVIAIGHALGLAGGPTVTRGVVSALDRTIVGAEGEELTGLVQTDAAINEGNSGGPLVNNRGEVVGINTARISGGFGIGFAININAARETAARLIALGPPPPPGYLGAFGSDITPALAVLIGLPVSSGFGVEQLDPRSPAALAGLRVDDIIVGMNETLIRTSTDLAEFLRRNPPETAVKVRVVRGDFFSGFGLIAFDLKLAERETS
jgi:S1-C subfamily serine protease